MRAPEQRLPNGGTHVAARCGAAEAATGLIARKFNVDAVDAAIQTPLYSAAEFGHLDIATILLGAGARLNFDAKGEAILLRPDSRLNFDAKGEGAPLNSPLHLAATHGPLEMVELLLKHSANVNAHAAIVEIKTPLGRIKRGGETPLHDAARGTCTECAARLLERGADIHATDVLGLTPFLWAVEAGREQTAALLLDAGADVNHHVGDSIPLHIAAAWPSRAKRSCRGANIPDRAATQASPGHWQPCSAPVAADHGRTPGGGRPAVESARA
jgi:protein DGCR14